MPNAGNFSRMFTLSSRKYGVIDAYRVVKLHRRLDGFAPVTSAEPAQPEFATATPPAIDPGTAAQMQRHTT